ncbi:MAG: hypothetical protein N3A57_05835 [Negativicutes bacterium]|nr:hypothetical protein [Negativicutes bacterium]
MKMMTAARRIKRLSTFLLMAAMVVLVMPWGTGLAMDQNILVFSPESGVNSIWFNFSGWYSVTSGESWGGVSAATVPGNQLYVYVNADRENSSQVANWFRNNAGAQTPVSTSSHIGNNYPPEMNFALTGTLTINGTYSYDVVVGQAGVGLDNDWWVAFGGSAGIYQGGGVMTPDRMFLITPGSSDSLFNVRATGNTIAGNYAYVPVYTQNSTTGMTASQPVPMSWITNLNVINMTPWDIYLSNTGSGTASFFPSLSSMVISGLNNKNITPYHSVKIPMYNPNQIWSNQGQYPPQLLNGTLAFYINSDGPDISGNVGYLTLSLSSSQQWFDNYKNTQAGSVSPLPVLSVGSVSGLGGNYGWQSGSYIGNTTAGTAYTSQGLPYTVYSYDNCPLLVAGLVARPYLFPGTSSYVGNSGNWQIFTGASPLSRGVVTSPSNLNSSGLIYPNFSAIAPVSLPGGATAQGSLDLIAMIQSGDGAELSVIFLAVPHNGQG